MSLPINYLSINKLPNHIIFYIVTGIKSILCLYFYSVYQKSNLYHARKEYQLLIMTKLIN